ncbi:MAG TPA: NAD-dependent epimerase/dehydratase family protein [Anaerolineae bacterium]|nr:NAD-dependent epimerase/dehydratase family protein [Anaerolineae bacterium]
MAYLRHYRQLPVLITGGLGFIGSNLAHRLVGLGARVTLVDNLLPDTGWHPANIADIQPVVRLILGDIGDPEVAQAAVRDQAVIFNLAGSVSHIDSMRNPLMDLEANARAHLVLLEAVRQVNPDAVVVYAGTRQQYGAPQYLPVDEAHRNLPNDINGINKLAGEWYHRIYYRAYGIQTCSLRLTNTYGPRQLIRHPRQGFIGWFVRQAILGETITVYGDGQQRRDMVEISDVVDAFLRAGAMPEAWGHVFNLGHDPVPLLEIAQMCVELAGRGQVSLVPWPEERKRIDIGDVYCSYERIRQTLGWEPKTPLRPGLQRMIDFYQRYGDSYLTPPEAKNLQPNPR